MKKLFILMLTLLTSLFASSVVTSVTANETIPEMPGEDCVWVWHESVHPIIAGQHYQVGEITLSTDGVSIFLHIQAYEGSLFDEVHIYLYDNLEDIPTDGRPAPGQAPHKFELEVETDSLIVELPWDVIYMDDIYPVVHLAFTQTAGFDIRDGSEFTDGPGETAYGGDNPNEGPGWWFYMDHIFTGEWICGEPPVDPPTECDCETVYAYFGVHSIEFDSQAWGWYAPFMAGTFELYAGAGQNDLSKGTFVGYITVDLLGNISFDLEEGFTIHIEVDEDGEAPETHFYIGGEVPERIPGQWQSIDMDNPVYMTFHMVVCGEFETESDGGPPPGRGRN